MPIYAFECSACGHRFDRLQKLSDPDPAACPSCNESQVRRQLTAPQFRLAGGGWYETDFKKDGDKKRNLAGDSGAGDGGSAGGGSSDTAKADSKPVKSAGEKPGESKPAATKSSGSGTTD